MMKMNRKYPQIALYVALAATFALPALATNSWSRTPSDNPAEPGLFTFDVTYDDITESCPGSAWWGLIAIGGDCALDPPNSYVTCPHSDQFTTATSTTSLTNETMTLAAETYDLAVSCTNEVGVFEGDVEPYGENDVVIAEAEPSPTPIPPIVTGMFPSNFQLPKVMANAKSVITQTLPIWGLVAGIILAVAAVGFVLHLTKKVPHAKR